MVNEPRSPGNDVHDPTGSLIARVEPPFAAAGPLSGLSYVVKDLVDLAGSPTSAGNPEFNDWRGTPVSTSSVISRLSGAGARLVGKAHLHELAYGITGVNPHYGTPLNPIDENAIPGGSSSGSAVAVAAKLADFSIGTDTAGSVRVPAACCGLVSLRPTWGTIGSDGVVPLAPSFDTVGVFARDPIVLREACRQLLNSDAPVRRWEQAVVLDEALQLAEQQVQRGVLAVTDKLSRLGIPVREVPFRLLDEVRETLRVRQANEAWQSYGKWIREASPRTGKDVRHLLQIAEALAENDVARAAMESQRLVSEIETIVAGQTLIVLPTIPSAPPRIRDLANDDIAMAFRVRVMKLVALASLAGLPVLTLPVHVSEDGPPGSCQLIGPRGSDRALLDLGTSLMPVGRAAMSPDL